jgi:hypothetical protein
MKKIILSILILGTLLSASAQSNCKLVNSSTYSVPNSTKVVQSNGLNAVPNHSCSMDTGKWIYIAYSKNSNNVAKLYMNGILQDTGIYLKLSYSWSRIDIGASFFTSYRQWYNGLFDELRVSNVERTSNEIQSHFNNNSAFSKDNNTIGLYHFDENSGTTANGTVGIAGSITNAQWVNGKFGSCLSYNGTSSRTQINLSVPSNSFTIEFWVYIPNKQDGKTVLSTYGMNTNDFLLYKKTTNVTYKWSTGASGNSITINPQNYKYVWVTDGNCYDTIWFDSEKKNVYDTISVQDTLIINAKLTGTNPLKTNLIKVYPNPAKDYLVIDFGNYASMAGYEINILDVTGKSVYSSAINKASETIDLNTWTGKGVYFIKIYDKQSQQIENRKIVIQ